MAEKQLLQARIKSINSLLDNNTKQIESTRSKIVSILPNPSYNKCQEFIEKVKELRFKKVKDRQVRKLNLINKKEGNITWQSTNCRQVQVPPTRASPTWLQVIISSQAGRQSNLANNNNISSQSTVRQAVRQVSLADSTPPQAERAISWDNNNPPSLLGKWHSVSGR